MSNTVAYNEKVCYLCANLNLIHNSNNDLRRDKY